MSRARILADYVAGGTTAAEFDVLDGLTSTTAELNILDGVTSTTAELNYVDGVTSNVQTQLDTKATSASPDFTGTVDLTGTTVSLDDDEISLDKVNGGTLGTGTIGGTTIINTSGAITTTGALTVTNTGLNYIGDAASDGEGVLNLVDTNAGNETMALECINDSASVGTATAIGFQTWSGSHTGKIVATLDATGTAHTNFDFHLHNGTNADSRLKIGYDGDVTVKTGNLVIGTSGNGIDFSANTDDETGAGAISAGGELLDDYEEGTWTPTCSGTDPTNRGCTYVKIGKVCHLQGEVDYLDDEVAPTISGLPFSNTSGPAVAGSCFCYNMELDGPGVSPMLKINAGSSDILIYSFQDNSLQSMHQSTGRLTFQLSYEPA